MINRNIQDCRRRHTRVPKQNYYDNERINDQTLFLFLYHKVFVKQIISNFLCNDIVNIIIKFIEPKRRSRL